MAENHRGGIRSTTQQTLEFYKALIALVTFS